VAFVFGNTFDDINDNINAVRALYENDFIYHDSLTAITENQNSDPIINLELYQNYPNPFNPVTTIRYYLPKSTNVVLKIYNIVGQEVVTIVNENQNTGEQSKVWNGLDQLGNEVSSGIYIYQLQAGRYHKSRKMVLLR
jgi:flagellar hook assembly protein FlgD